MLTPFFLAISSILSTQACENGVIHADACEHRAPVREGLKEGDVVNGLVAGIAHVNEYGLCLPNVCTHPSVFLRSVASALKGRHSSPRPRGDQGIEPTPNNYSNPTKF